MAILLLFVTFAFVSCFGGSGGNDDSLDTSKAIIEFSFDTPEATGIINETKHTVSITVPYETDVTGLVPVIIYSGAKISPVSGLANDFTTPVIYTVTAADDSTQDYTVTVTVAGPPHHVTYNGNGSTGGSVPISTSEYGEGEEVTVAGNTGYLVNPGYSFAGWTTNPEISGESVSYAAGASFTMGTTDVILYAVWIPVCLKFTSKNYDIKITGFDYSLKNSLAVPPGVTSIESMVFMNCSMTSITIPSSVITIGASALFACPSLTNIWVDPSNPNYTSSSGVLFNKAMTILLQMPDGLTGSYSIPTGVIEIADWAFHTSKLTNVTIPSGVITIKASFVFCFNLKNINIPSSVTSIADAAFFYCTSLAGFVVDAENQNYTSSSGVLYSKGMTDLIQVPGSMTGGYNIPSGVTSIKYGAFTGSDLASVYIPSSVISISESALVDCQSMTSIQVSSGNQKYESNSGVLFDKDMKRLIQAPGAITGSYSIPEGVTTIGGGAFFSCHHLTSVSIPSGVLYIEDNALFQCGGLTSITIPSSVKNIGVEAFSGCGLLSSIIMLGSTPPVLASSNAFNANISGFQIHVPDQEAVIAYKAAAVWRGYAAKIVTP